VNLRGGHQALDSTGLLEFQFGGLKLTWGHLGYENVIVRGDDLVEYIV